MNTLVLERLQTAISDGEVLEVIYYGGSQPGTLRQIAPMLIQGDKVKARCFNPFAVKTFLVSKIGFPDASVPSPEPIVHYDSTKVPSVRYVSLVDFEQTRRSELEAEGWFVEFVITTDSQYFKLFAKFKNGNPRKTPFLILAHERYRWDEETMVERQRKWLVIDKAGHTKSFGLLDSAVDCFYETLNS